MKTDAGYAGGISFAFDAGAKGFYGVEGRQGIFGGKVVADRDGILGEERREGGAVRDGLVGGDRELAP